MTRKAREKALNDSQSVLAHIWNPSTGGAGGTIANSRPAWVTRWDPVLKRRDRQREKRQIVPAWLLGKRHSPADTQMYNFPLPRNVRVVSIVRGHPGMWYFVTSTLRKPNPNAGPKGRKSQGQHYKWKTGKVKPARWSHSFKGKARSWKSGNLVPVRIMRLMTWSRTLNCSPLWHCHLWNMKAWDSKPQSKARLLSGEAELRSEQHLMQPQFKSPHPVGLGDRQPGSGTQGCSCIFIGRLPCP